MELQVLTILENGASKILPQRSGVLRVLLILRDSNAQTQSRDQGKGLKSAVPLVPRRVLPSIPAALG
jgi:hypothetical protein